MRKESQQLIPAKKNVEQLQVANAIFQRQKMCWRLPFTAEVFINCIG
jgi:hypothetical protein